MSQHKELKYRLLFDELTKEAEKELDIDEFIRFIEVVQCFVDDKINYLS